MHVVWLPNYNPSITSAKVCMFELALVFCKESITCMKPNVFDVNWGTRISDVGAGMDK